jgi:hypothetical protein
MKFLSGCAFWLAVIKNRPETVLPGPFQTGQLLDCPNPYGSSFITLCIQIRCAMDNNT